MNDDELIDLLCDKIKEIEKETSRNYLGKLSNEKKKQFQKDAVGMIDGILTEIFKENK